MNVRYEELLPHEIVAARTKRPVAYLPIGGVEWHGKHLAVGNDALKVHALCVRVAEKHGGLVLPALYWGENRERALMESSPASRDAIAEEMDLPAENFAPGYMHEDADNQDFVYTRLLVHCLHESASLGFHVTVICAGHYPLLNHARAAVELFHMHRRRDTKAHAWAFTGYELVRDEFPDAGDHAAHWETSLLMALRGELVDMSQLPADPDAQLVGVGGKDPREYASAELGERAVQAIVDKVGAKVDELISS